MSFDTKDRRSDEGVDVACIEYVGGLTQTSQHICVPASLAGDAALLDLAAARCASWWCRSCDGLGRGAGATCLTAAREVSMSVYSCLCVETPLLCYVHLTRKAAVHRGMTNRCPYC